MAGDVPVDFQMFKTRSMKKFPVCLVFQDSSFLREGYATVDVWILGSELSRRVEMDLHAPEFDQLG
jgi:hypothetical protein